MDKILGQWIDLDKARVDSAVESTELGHKADIALVDGFVGIRADNAARDGAEESNGATETVNCGINVSHELVG